MTWYLCMLQNDLVNICHHKKLQILCVCGKDF